MLAPRRPTRTLTGTATRALFAASLLLLTAGTALAQSDNKSQNPNPKTQMSNQSGLPSSIAITSDTDSDFQLGEATGQALGFTVFQHVVRLRETKTRRELGGAFFSDWFKSVSNAGRSWDDGGKFFTNYIAHPQGGAVYAHIYRQNDPSRRDLQIGEPGYGGMLLRAMAFSAAISTQFELGPVSEASIGNVGMRNATKMAWVDLVITPLLGTAWMVGEDAIDGGLLRRLDETNEVLRNTLRAVLNPARSGANLSRKRWPWFRERDH